MIPQLQVQENKRILYATDIEGRLLSFLKWIEGTNGQIYLVNESGNRIPQAVYRSTKENITEFLPLLASCRLNFADEECFFVFGGDAFDDGYDYTVGKLLCNFKADYPERVTLLAGNRDINKLRRARELEPGNVLRLYDCVSEPRWNKPEDNNLSAWLKRSTPIQDKSGWLALSDDERAAYFLNWQDECTLGIKEGASKIAKEARVLFDYGQHDSPDGLTDDQVREKAMRDHYNPLYALYNLSAVLIHRDGDVLFTHGYFGPESLQVLNLPEGHNNHLDWLLSLSPKALAEQETELYRAWNAILDHEKQNISDEFEYLVADDYDPHAVGPYLATTWADYYSLPLNKGSTVIQHSPLHDGDIGLPPKFVDLLNRMGINLVVHGHKPQGDNPRIAVCYGSEPTLTREADKVLMEGAVHLACVDTTYARKPYPCSDGLEILQECERHFNGTAEVVKNKTAFSRLTEKGEHYQAVGSALQWDITDTPEKALIGRWVTFRSAADKVVAGAEHWLVEAIIPTIKDEPMLRLSKKIGFTTHYLETSSLDVRLEGNVVGIKQVVAPRNDTQLFTPGYAAGIAAQERRLHQRTSMTSAVVSTERLAPHRA